MRSTISVTQFDKQRLQHLLTGIAREQNPDRGDLWLLEQEIARAEIISSTEAPAGLVTMNSRVRLTDLDSSEPLEYTLVFPHEADYKEGRISILAPLGTALLGFQVGDVVEWAMPAGTRRLRIDAVLYQPEAAGHYHL
jgi:regulator of nucleoside diphosphate kinase